MVAELSDLAAAPPNAAEYLTYQPPAGSTLTGGSVDVNMSADGFGNTGGGSAVGESLLSEPSLGNVFFHCVAFFQVCGPAPDFSGVVSLPNDAQGNLIAAANCTSSTGTSCDQNAKNDAWALMQVMWAHLLLSSSESPTGSGFTGSALQPGIRGTAHVVFTAAEPAGPGHLRRFGRGRRADRLQRAPRAPTGVSVSRWGPIRAPERSCSTTSSRA